MLRQHQTKFGVPNGNCFTACVASLLEMDIDTIPDFVPLYGDNWLVNFRKWLEPKGLDYFEIWPKDIAEYIPSGFLLATGKSPRGEFSHCVIVKKNDNNDFLFIHDPHPDNTFLENISLVGSFAPLKSSIFLFANQLSTPRVWFRFVFWKYAFTTPNP